MKPSSIEIVYFIEKKLLHFPLIVNKLKNKDTDFILFLEKWIIDIEEFLTKNNVSKVAELAGHRSKIIAASFLNNENGSKRKRQVQVAAEVLYDIQNCITNIVLPYQTKINEAREIVAQLLMILGQSGTIKFNNGNFQNFIMQLWSLLFNSEQLKPSLSKVITLIGNNDTLRLISEEVDLEFF